MIFKAKGRMSVDEIKMAEETIVRCVKNEIFAKEIKELKKKMFVSRSSPIQRLGPFLKRDLICVGDRIKAYVKLK